MLDANNQLVWEQPLVVTVRSGADGPVVVREPVCLADLSEQMGETWRDGCLRQAHPSVALEELAMRLRPCRVSGASSSCSGFELELRLPNGQCRRRPFSIRSLRHVAGRAIGRLMKQGPLDSDQAFMFELEVESPGSASSAAAPSAGAFNIHIRSLPLTYLEVPLRALREQAVVVDAADESVFAVFFTAHAFAKAEECAHRGAKSEPSVETGGALLGSLVSCPASGEFYVIVTDVVELPEAEQAAFSLAYSGQSWLRIQRIVAAKQKAHPHRAERLVGQCHGHNFLPGSGRACDECPKRPVCDRSSAFLSDEDDAWTRAVFPRQPWALCQIFGFSARGERHHRLYTRQDGQPQRRGYYLLPEFNPDRWGGQAAKPVNDSTL